MAIRVESVEYKATKGSSGFFSETIGVTLKADPEEDMKAQELMALAKKFVALEFKKKREGK